MIMGIDRPSARADQLSVTGACISLASAPHRPAGEREREAFARQPIDPLDGLVVGTVPTLLLMQLFSVVVETDAEHEAGTIVVA
jgi:hypothetical protein